MPIYTEIVATFKGKGSKKIHEWAQEGHGGVFFARVFGYDYENATADDWDEWESDFDSYRTGNMCCGATMKQDKSVVLSMNVCGCIPYGVFEKIAETFPEIHADGRFIQQTEEYFGNIVIENGGFLWTKFDNPGRRSGKKGFFFDSFFKDPEEEPDMDQMQREVLELLKFDRDNMRDILANGEQMPKKLDYHSQFYFSELELQAIAGDAESQYQIALELRNDEFFDNNPKIYNKKDKIERECCEQCFDDMARSWLKKAALNGQQEAQFGLVITCIDRKIFKKAKEYLMAFLDDTYFAQEMDSYLDDDATSLLRLICLTDLSDLMEFYFDGCDESVDDIRLDDCDYDEVTLLEYAVLCGSFNVVKFLIEECDATFSLEAEEGRSLWIFAIQSGNLDLVKYLAEDCGFDINCKDKYGETPLHYAVAYFCANEYPEGLELIKWLVDSGADLNCFDVNGDTPLHLAAEGGNEILVQYFIKDCRMDSSIDDGHGTPLMRTAREGNLSGIRYLVENGADLYCCTDDGFSVLSLAALHGKSDIVKFLIKDCHMDPNWHPEGGNIAVNCAAYGNHTEIVKWLINDAGVGINEKDGEGETPLGSAMSGFPDHAENYDFELVKWLVENGADVNCYDDNFYTPFSEAFFYGFSRAVRFFVKEIKDLDLSAVGRILNVFDIDESPYKKALKFLEDQAEHNSVPAMRVLIDYYAYEDEKKYEKWLKKAVDCGDVESINKGLVDAIDSHAESVAESVDDPDGSEEKLDLVKYLVEHGADINFISGDDGWSFLHYALWMDDWMLADYLIDAGADINLVDGMGLTALSACVHIDGLVDDEISLRYARKLVSHGADVKTMANALLDAALAGRLEVVRFFIEECKIDPNYHDQDGDTAIMCAAEGWNNKEETEDDHNIGLVKWLVEKGADINCFDDNKMTSLHVAAKEGNDIVVKYFIEECHMDPAINYGAGTPAELAKGNSAIVRYLHKKEKEYSTKEGK